MQAKYPDLKFAAFAYREKDHYQIHTGLIEQSRKGLKGMIAEAVIVSRTDFVDRYLGDLPKSIYYSGSIVLFTVPWEYCEVIANRYEDYFSRIR